MRDKINLDACDIERLAARWKYMAECRRTLANEKRKLEGECPIVEIIGLENSAAVYERCIAELTIGASSGVPDAGVQWTEAEELQDSY